MIEQYQQEHNVPAIEIAAALAHLLQGDSDFLLTNKPQRKQKSRDDWDRDDRGRDRGRDRPRRDRAERGDRERSPRRERQPRDTALDEGMERYRIEVGHDHQVKPGNIVGAIANEADIESKYIGRISIYDDHSTVDLPEGMPKELLYTLKKVWVSGQQLKISLDGKEKISRGSDKPSSNKRKPGKRHPVSNRDTDKGRGSDEKKGKLSLKKRVRRK